MYTRNNPPHVPYRLDYSKQTFAVMDFGRDDQGNLINVEVDKINFAELANAAAEGCDIVRIRQLLKGQPVTRGMLETQAPAGNYGTVDTDTTLLDAVHQVDAQVTEAKTLYAKLPEDLRNGMTLDQFANILDTNPTYLETYIAIKAAQAKPSAAAPATTDTEVKQND